MKTIQTVKKDITKIVRKYLVIGNLTEDKFICDLVSYIFLKVIKK